MVNFFRGVQMATLYEVRRVPNYTVNKVDWLGAKQQRF
jgi:hypothetical protein